MARSFPEGFRFYNRRPSSVPYFNESSFAFTRGFAGNCVASA